MRDDRFLDWRGGLGSRLLFLLTLWLSLGTAIVCAVVPAGLPLTRTTGSAFDPSTTIVALRSRPPATEKATLLRVGEGEGAIGGSGDSVGLVVLSPALVTTRVVIARIAPIALAAIVLVPRAIDSVLYARPPPAA